MNKNAVIFDIRDIDATITAAVLQSVGIGKPVRGVRMLDHYEHVYILGAHHPQMYLQGEYRVFEKEGVEDLSIHRVYNGPMTNGDSYLRAVTQFFEIEIDDRTLEQYEFVLSRMEACDSGLTLKDQSLLYYNHMTAYMATIEGGEFEFTWFYKPEMENIFKKFLTSIKKELSEKTFKKSVGIRKRFLGIPYGSKIESQVAFINTHLWLAPWVSKIASYSLDNLAVFEHGTNGEPVYALKSFTPDGYYAMDWLLYQANKT